MRGGGHFMNLVVLIVIGIIIADLVKNYQGTNALLQSTSAMWGQSVNGMLGKTG